MNEQTRTILQHLKKLVSFDTRNPPQDITVDGDIFTYLKNQLKDFNISIQDSGNGCISLLAVRGEPECLFNVHIDTVPKAEGWTKDPFTLTVENGKAYGLGACDIKGATACLLTLANDNKNDMALLFSSDEEAGSSVAVKAFLKQQHDFTQVHYFTQVIVAEPTCGLAVTAHRGIQTAEAQFTGIAGHASEQRALHDNAIHKAADWLTRATDWIGSQQQLTHQSLTGIPFNAGTIEGGVKANMIAQSCQIKFGFRPLPGQKSEQLLKNFANLTEEVVIQKGFFGPTLPADNQDFKKAITSAESLINQYQLQPGEAVNFWTEASLFSQAGFTAIVLGPGHIAQAHAADEWVEIIQLERACLQYKKVIDFKTCSGEK